MVQRHLEWPLDDREAGDPPLSAILAGTALCRRLWSAGVRAGRRADPSKAQRTDAEDAAAGVFTWLAVDEAA